MRNKYFGLADLYYNSFVVLMQNVLWVPPLFVPMPYIPNLIPSVFPPPPPPTAS